MRQLLNDDLTIPIVSLLMPKSEKSEVRREKEMILGSVSLLFACYFSIFQPLKYNCTILHTPRRFRYQQQRRKSRIRRNSMRKERGSSGYHLAVLPCDESAWGRHYRLLIVVGLLPVASDQLVELLLEQLKLTTCFPNSKPASLPVVLGCLVDSFVGIVRTPEHQRYYPEPLVRHELPSLSGCWRTRRGLSPRPTSGLFHSTTPSDLEGWLLYFFLFN